MEEKLKGYKFEGLFSSHEVFCAFAMLSAFTCLQTGELCLPGPLAQPHHSTLDVLCQVPAAPGR